MDTYMSYYDRDEIAAMLKNEKETKRKDKIIKEAKKQYEASICGSYGMATFLKIIFFIVDMVIIPLLALSGVCLLLMTQEQFVITSQYIILVAASLLFAIFLIFAAQKNPVKVMEKSKITEVLSQALEKSKDVKIMRIAPCSGKLREPTKDGKVYIKLTEKEDKSNTAVCEIKEIPKFSNNLFSLSKSSVRIIESKTIYYIELYLDKKVHVYLVCGGILNFFDAATTDKNISLLPMVGVNTVLIN